MNTTGSLKRHVVSMSMPLKPNAQSPFRQITGLSGKQTVDAQCYRANTDVNFALAGFTPNEFVGLGYNGGLLDAVQVGADGSFAGSFGAGSTGDGELVHATQLTAADSAGN